jgi:prepilin-type N-terminal cleavage/methylation domain-containing protein
MRHPQHRHPLRRNAAGFTLLETVVALLLLAICLVPAANALSGAVAAPARTATAARNLDCVGSLMETVLAEPYDRLLSLAMTPGVSVYPVPVDVACPPRKVVIARYGVESTGQIGPGGTSNYLLSVSVGLANAADGNPFTLTTLVAR